MKFEILSNNHYFMELAPMARDRQTTLLVRTPQGDITIAVQPNLGEASPAMAEIEFTPSNKLEILKRDVNLTVARRDAPIIGKVISFSSVWARVWDAPNSDKE